MANIEKTTLGHICSGVLSFFDLKFISGVGEQPPKSSVSPLRGSSGSTDRGHLPFLACFLPEKKKETHNIFKLDYFWHKGSGWTGDGPPPEVRFTGAGGLGTNLRSKKDSTFNLFTSQEAASRGGSNILDHYLHALFDNKYTLLLLTLNTVIGPPIT